MSTNKEIPQRVYLQVYGDGEPDDLDEISWSDVSWCSEKIFDQEER